MIPVDARIIELPRLGEAKMFKRILVPLDGSALSEKVLPIARQLADSFGSDIDLVYIIPTPADEIPEELTGQAIRDGEGYLKEMAESLSADVDKNRIGYSVQVGHPASKIIEQSETKEETLILMSTHGYTGLQRLLLGSVAGKVVQAAATPVLLIPAATKSPEGGPVEFKRVIMPLDGSKIAESVVPYVVSLCKMLDLELIVLRSYHPNFPGSSVRMHDVSKIVHDSAENYVKEKVKQLKNEGLERVSHKVLRGLAAQQINDYVLKTPNSITAMCTHGRHGVGRWMLGSVTNNVIHSSEWPVLVIRGTD
jgi:nucleotide-binding universal stress UspA family protein